MADLAALDDLVGDAAGSDPEWADLTDQWPPADLHASLKRVVRRIEADFTRKRAEFQDATTGRLDPEEFRLIRRDYARWKSSAGFFKSLVLNRLEEVRLVLSEVNREATGSEFNVAWRDRVGRLVAAVAEHREASGLAGIRPESHDVELWDVLDGMVAERGMPSLLGRLGLAADGEAVR